MSPVKAIITEIKHSRQLQGGHLWLAGTVVPGPQVQPQA